MVDAPTTQDLRSVIAASFRRNEAGYRALALTDSATFPPPRRRGPGGIRATLRALGDAALDPILHAVLVGLALAGLASSRGPEPEAPPLIAEAPPDAEPRPPVGPIHHAGE